ncbi:TRIC cation channel family protein [Endozoicomonas sp. SESOKO3]|uniref:TRIC cation channel family protein n=1 Tax=Endozoicomonas sp. SESOKO3 TaxID=2828744 RepID=UPI002147896A|nr:TRIC cation channel family protein [Endozoicomonas sp. SESOKO3]
MLLYILDLFGTAVFAISGAWLACRKDMDIFGAMVLAFVAAVGGGARFAMSF